MENYNKLLAYIEETGMTAEELLNALTDWHGMSIISDEFIENARDCEGWNI